MLREAVIASGALLLAVAAALFVAIRPGPAIPLAVFGVLILVGTVFERRYRGTDDRPPTGPGWTPTGERFRDPAGGEMVEVWYERNSGRRRYVRDRGAGRGAVANGDGR